MSDCSDSQNMSGGDNPDSPSPSPSQTPSSLGPDPSSSASTSHEAGGSSPPVTLASSPFLFSRVSDEAGRSHLSEKSSQPPGTIGDTASSPIALSSSSKGEADPDISTSSHFPGPSMASFFPPVTVLDAVPICSLPPSPPRMQPSGGVSEDLI